VLRRRQPFLPMVAFGVLLVCRHRPPATTSTAPSSAPATPATRGTVPSLEPCPAPSIKHSIQNLSRVRDLLCISHHALPPGMHPPPQTVLPSPTTEEQGIWPWRDSMNPKGPKRHHGYGIERTCSTSLSRPPPPPLLLKSPLKSATRGRTTATRHRL